MYSKQRYACECLVNLPLRGIGPGSVVVSLLLFCVILHTQSPLSTQIELNSVCSVCDAAVAKKSVYYSVHTVDSIDLNIAFPELLVIYTEVE